MVSHFSAAILEVWKQWNTILKILEQMIFILEFYMHLPILCGVWKILFLNIKKTSKVYFGSFFSKLIEGVFQ